MYTEEQLAKMRRGSAPQRFNEEAQKWVSKELHPIFNQGSQENYDVFEVWADEPTMTDPFKRLRDHNAKL